MTAQQSIKHVDMRKSWSLASLSTRVSSLNSLNDLLRRENDVDRTLTERTTSAICRRHAALVGALLLCCWAWTKYVGRLTKRPSKWNYGRVAMAAQAAITTACAAVGVTNETKNGATELPPGQNLLVVHPHGCYCIGAIVNLSGNVRRKGSDWHGVFVGVADALFKLPVVREFLLLVNCRPANTRMISTLMASGKTVALCPGGIHEQMATDPNQERAYFPPNLGFVRQAIKNGVPLVPVYTFGENQLYDVPEWSRRASRKLKEATGAGVPLALGRLGLPLVPKATSLQTFVGNAVEVGPADSNPSEEFVRTVFDKYCRELRRLFDEHKDGALPADVAARGLDIIWRGHETDAMELSRGGHVHSLAAAGNGRLGSSEKHPVSTPPNLQSRL